MVPRGWPDRFRKPFFTEAGKEIGKRGEITFGPRGLKSPGVYRDREDSAVVAVCRPMGPDRNAIAMQANPSAPFVHPLARLLARSLALPFPVMTIITGNDCSVGSASAPAAIGGWKPPYRVSPRSSMRADCHMLPARQSVSSSCRTPCGRWKKFRSPRTGKLRTNRREDNGRPILEIFLRSRGPRVTP